MGMFDTAEKFRKAAEAGDYETVERYLKNYYWRPQKVNLNERNQAGATALYLAAGKGHIKIVQRMLRFSIDPNIADDSGNTPLLIALTQKRRDVALALIESSLVKVNQAAVNFVVPLHMAAGQGDLEIVKALADRGADLNAVSQPNGYTALHWAVVNGNATVAEFLVQVGARTDIPDHEGKYALDRARDKGEHLVKIVSAAPAPKPQPAAVDENEAEEDTPTAAYPDNDRWIRSGEQRVTHIVEHPEINRRLTEIFNFEARERTILMENLQTGAETLSRPESFDTITESALRKAFAEFVKLGGTVDEAQILGKRGQQRGFNP